LFFLLIHIHQGDHIRQKILELALPLAFNELLDKIVFLEFFVKQKGKCHPAKTLKVGGMGSFCQVFGLFI